MRLGRAWAAPGLAAAMTGAAFAGPPPGLIELSTILRDHPYVVATVDGAERAGILRIKSDGTATLEAVDDAETSSRFEGWQRRHAVAITNTWLIGIRKDTGKAAWWAPVRDARFDRPKTGSLPNDRRQLVPLPADRSLVVYLVRLPAGGGSPQATVKKVSKKAKKATKSKKAKPYLPKIYQVVTATDQASAISIVFFSAGFAQSRLPSYRCEVDTIAEKIVDDPGFECMKGRLNIYRLDLYDTNETGTLQVDCTPPATPYPTVGPGTTDAKKLALPFTDDGVTLTFDDGGAKAASLLAKVRAVIGNQPSYALALANSENDEGEGYQDGQVGIVGLSDVAGGGWKTVSHELGHTLGLYDERADAPKMNLVANAPNAIEQATATTSPDQIVWKARCGPKCDTLSSKVHDDCSVPWTQPEPQPQAIGLWLGANGSCSQYAPAGECRMRHHVWDFCAACQDYICALGAQTALPVVTATPGSAITLTAAAGPGGIEAYAGRRLDPAREWLAEVPITGDVRGWVVIDSFRARLAAAPSQAEFVVSSALGASADRLTVSSVPGPRDKSEPPLTVNDRVSGKKWPATRIVVPSAPLVH